MTAAEDERYLRYVIAPSPPIAECLVVAANEYDFSQAEDQKPTGDASNKTVAQRLRFIVC